MTTTHSDTTLDDVDRRLTHLEDVREIEQLKYRYASFCDDGYNPDGIASLFACLLYTSPSPRDS